VAGEACRQTRPAYGHPLQVLPCPLWACFVPITSAGTWPLTHRSFKGGMLYPL
jgi:hypothetical protein